MGIVVNINYMRAFMKDYEFSVIERKMIIDKMFIHYY